MLTRDVNQNQRYCSTYFSLRVLTFCSWGLLWACWQGLAVSLLERTEGLQGGSLSMLLTTQYRMNAAISDWSSQEMYGGALRAAEAVGGRLLADLEVCGDPR